MANTKRRFNIHTLTECALMAALASVLSMIKVYQAPFGGSVTLMAMVPIVFLSIHKGVSAGLAGGFVFSIIQLILGLNNLGWVPSVSGKLVCALFDYILPYTLLGLGGIFSGLKITKNDKLNRIISAVLGAVLVAVIRYGCHIITGVAVWHALDLEWYADDPSHIVNLYSPWLFSIIYNGAFMIPEIIETAIGTPVVCTAIDGIGKKKH